MLIRVHSWSFTPKSESSRFPHDDPRIPTSSHPLIDDLKGVCANYGPGNVGNEFKIITQVFLYKFLSDKFAYEVKRIAPSSRMTSFARSPFFRPNHEEKSPP